MNSNACLKVLMTVHRTSGDFRFEVLLLENLDRLYSLARRWCRSAEDAEDLVQDAALKAWRAFAQLEDDRRGAAWLDRILYNTFADRYEKSEREALNDSLDNAEGTVVSFMRADLALDLRRAFESLPAEFSLVVWMMDGEGMGYREIAEALGISEGTVASRAARGRAKLRAILSSHNGSQEFRQ